MAREFEELALDGHNYPTWAMDVKISLALRGIIHALTPPAEREVPLSEQFKFNALYIIRHHIHPDLKSEYVMEEEPSTLWVALQTRYEQQKAVILPEANHEWTHLRLQDFKSIEDYNHAVHKICAKLRFCEKEPTDGDKIEKTLQTMLPSDRILQHQYRARNYQTYSDLIHDLLQAEKHDELTMRNHHQRPVGSNPLPEVHHSVKGKEKVDGSNNHHKNFGKFKKGKRNNKHKKNKSKGQGSGKGKHFHKAFKCHKCGGNNHTAKKCRIPHHLVELYQKSLKDAGKATGSYETHFNAEAKGATTSENTFSEAAMPKLTVDDYMDTENTIVEYNSNDVFGDLN